jgi:formylglycine-generating enzyme required for sulfatase activity
MKQHLLVQLLDAIVLNPNGIQELTSALRKEGDARGELLELSYTLRSVTEATPERMEKQRRLQELLAAGVEPIAPTRASQIGMKFSYVPTCSFFRGSESSSRLGQLTVAGGVFMSTWPVTQLEWKKVMGTDPSYFLGSNRPVECVTWLDCQEFCEKFRGLTGLAIRLPNELEWEAACRGSAISAYSSGNDESALDSVGWYQKNGGGETHDVCQKKPNAWGLFDMHGNVYEWCQDVYLPGWAEMEMSIEHSEHRVIRGGSWGRPPEDCRSAARRGYPADSTNFSIGCRVCIDV